MNITLSEEELSDLRDALDSLADSIWTKDDLDAAAISVDAMASAFARALELPSAPSVSSASNVFFELVQHGLDAKAKSYATTIADIASLKIYDDDEESESKLEEAESARESLQHCLKQFIEHLRE